MARPGHIFPLRYAEGGVLKRDGQTESIVDLCILSDLYPAGVICEIINEDGTMARRDDLVKFSKDHDIKIVSVEDIIKYRKENNLVNITPDEPTETFIRKSAEYPSLPTSFGAFNIKNYKSYVKCWRWFLYVKTRYAVFLSIRKYPSTFFPRLRAQFSL